MKDDDGEFKWNMGEGEEIDAAVWRGNHPLDPNYGVAYRTDFKLLVSKPPSATQSGFICEGTCHADGAI